MYGKKKFNFKSVKRVFFNFWLQTFCTKDITSRGHCMDQLLSEIYLGDFPRKRYFEYDVDSITEILYCFLRYFWTNTTCVDIK